MKISRRQWLTRSLGYGVSGTLAGIGYGSLIEKRWLTVTRMSIPLAPPHANLAGLKVAMMGDFHHDDFGDEGLIRRAVEAVNEEQVDLVYLLGDYISSDAAAIVPLSELLRDLRPRLGTFGVMGNHDVGLPAPVIRRSLEKAGVRMLINEGHEFDHFTLVGMDSYRVGSPNLTFVFNQIAAAKPIILGWHEPDSFASYEDPRVALQVSGHTHGGQICAPFYGPIFLPPSGRIYPYGHYQRGHASLFVTRGIGTLDIPARFLCPPELVILSLNL